MATIPVPDFEAAEARLAGMRRPLLLTHTKPDGDAIGALLAVRHRLQSLGAEPLGVLFDPVPPRYRFLEQGDALAVHGQDFTHEELARADGVIVVDTCTYNQLAPLADWMRASRLPKLAIDHHVTRDELADHYVIDETAAATCLILLEWANACHWSLDPVVAEVLLVGIATDTGWFKHSNTDARTFAAAGSLVWHGAVPHKLHERLYQQESVARFRLRSLAYQSLELRATGRLAMMSLEQAAFSAAGAAMSETEDLVSEPLLMMEAVVSVLLVEQADGVIRVGFRSKPPLGPGSPDVDVAAIAGAFQGGGHRRAAGARLAGPLREARTRVAEAIERALS